MGSSTFGVDPVIDLLEKMERQVSRIENTPPEPGSSRTAHTQPADNSLEAQLFRDEITQAEQRGAAQLQLFTEALGRLKSQIPQLVEEAIASRLLEVEERFYAQTREIQQRTMENFAQSAQARVGTRMASFETALADQTAAIAAMQENTLKSDRNTERLLAGVDRLSAELMRLSGLAGAPVVTRRVASLSEARPASGEPSPVSRRNTPRDVALSEDSPSAKRSRRSPLAAVIAVLALSVLFALGFAGWWVYSNSALFRLPRNAAAPLSAPPAGSEAQIKTATDAAAEKNYPKAESIYRQVLKSEPQNRTAIRGLASVLFKQQRYDEAASVLKELSAQ